MIAALLQAAMTAGDDPHAAAPPRMSGTGSASPPSPQVACPRRGSALVQAAGVAAARWRYCRSYGRVMTAAWRTAYMPRYCLYGRHEEVGRAPARVPQPACGFGFVWKAECRPWTQAPATPRQCAELAGAEDVMESVTGGAGGGIEPATPQLGKLSFYH